jgi:hypothetical protein
VNRSRTIVKNGSEWAALRDFTPAYVGSGSDHELSLWRLMSASTSYGLHVALGNGARSGSQPIGRSQRAGMPSISGSR